MEYNAEQFINKTKAALHITSKNKNRLALRGFDLTGITNKKEDCVLILGLNSAGSNKDAKRERDSKEQYIYYVPKIHSYLGGWHYSNYFGCLFNLVEAVFGEGKAKWPWCNCSKVEFEKLIDRRAELKGFEEEIRDFYIERKNSPITIYVGDMFYYHETNSKKLPYKREMKNEMQSYYSDMVKMHIKELKDFNKNIKFVYINNAQVSRNLASTEEKPTHEKIDEVNVFYGSILSGGRMDSFSRKRLVKEIKSVIGK